MAPAIPAKTLDNLDGEKDGSIPLYVEGIDPGEATITAQLDMNADGTTDAEDSVTATVVKLDVDVDSDNTDPGTSPDGPDGVDNTALEDALEDRDGDGVHKVGKRVFINSDDDNKNGIPDSSDDSADYSAADNDLAKVELDYAYDNAWGTLAELRTAAGWVSTTGNAMTIEFEPSVKADKTNYHGSSDVYVKATANGSVGFEGNIATTGSGNPEVENGSSNAIHLQSHWGSGVKYTSIIVTPNP